MGDQSILKSLGKKEILSSLMESPLYFTMELQERLKLIRQLAEQFSDYEFRDHMMSWVKTGYLRVFNRGD